MKKGWRSLVILSLILAMLLGLCACSTASSVPSFIDDGADRFAAGKEEEDYSLPNSGALLQELIDNYSGSYNIPTASTMDEDDYEDALKEIGGDTSGDTSADASGDTSGDASGDGSASTEPVYIEVGSWDEFADAFYDAYAEPAEYLTVRFVNGFHADVATDFNPLYTELQRKDPIYVSNVAAWSTHESNNECLIQIDYNMELDEIVRTRNATKQLVDEAVQEIGAHGLSDYEIVCAVNEYLCDTVYYPPNEPYAPITHTAYGALADGVAVCEGYACAAKLILNAYGILCDIQVGYCIDGGGHAWNLVQLEGEWYQMDITWNDGGTENQRDDYLLVTDDYMRKSRYWDEPLYPVCASKPYHP